MEDKVDKNYKIVVANVSLSYKNKLTDDLIIENLSFEVKPKETFCILGSNGSGKTTIINSICGVIKPIEGTIELQSNINNGKPKIAFVNQDYRQSNLPWETVIENITYPLRFTNHSKYDRLKLGNKILKEILPSVNPNVKVYKLSGGQQQLVSIARAIVSNPDILICDEPLSAVDIIRANKAIKILEVNKLTNSYPAVWISHNIDEALLVGDYIALLSKKKKGFYKILKNPLEYPRFPEHLFEPFIATIKKEILDFLREESI